MSSQVGPLNVTFALIWAVFGAALISYMLFFPHIPLVDMSFFIIFAIVEGIALFVNKKDVWNDKQVSLRDTLSEVQTYVAKMGKPGSRWYQGWNAVVVLFAIFPSWIIARNVPNVIFSVIPLQIIVFGLLMGFLVFHWLRPEKFG